MQVGQECIFESLVYEDEHTHRSVRRLTPTDYWSHHQYFYFNMWTPDSRSVVISSNREDQIWRQYLIEVETGKAVCLNDLRQGRPNMAEVSRDGKTMLYSAGNELRRLDLADFAEETLYSQAEPWTGWGVYYGPTADHSRAVMVEIHKDDVIRAKTGWDNFRKQLAAKPRCRLVELDLHTGESNVLLEDACWFGHPNYRPNGKTIMFCHEGPWELVDSRLWFIDPDGSNLREGRKRDPNIPPSDSAERWGHEYWLADSSRAAYEYYTSRKAETTSINLLDPDTLEEEVLMTGSRYAHFISNRDNSMIVGDGHPKLAGGMIFIVDVAAKKEQAICYHGSSMEPYIDPRSGRPNTQMVHPHACFSPDSSKVVYSSDLHGSPAAYVVEV